MDSLFSYAETLFATFRGWVGPVDFSYTMIFVLVVGVILFLWLRSLGRRC